MLLARTTRGTHPLATSRAAQSAVLYAFTIAVLLLAGATSASAGGPRWISGPPYFYAWRVMVSWYTNQPQYFTDAGDLSSSVDHATADAMVAKAAAVWNIPTAALVLAQGGTLGEHVSSANVYATANGLVFPADVQPANYAAKQIAVVYDTDGSITDMLLGSGASDPSGCLQSGVTESVDSITHTSQIQHAILVLNGRCTGPEPEKQLQMQYQLERAFGRILGLGWSQVNDNVFTGSPAPTHTQALNWPIMHPIDIICGPYSYQCLPEPFTLRPDDISALQELYFIPQGQAPAGKMASWTNAGGIYGNVTFPNGQGMEGVNVVVRRRAPFWDTPEDWQTTSSVSGYSFRGQSATSMTSQGSSAAASLGAPFLDREGYWRIQSIPVPASQSWTDLVISTEPINPLYTGPYAIGSQAGNTMSPSGSAQVQVSQYLANGRDTLVNFTAADAAPTCTSQTDGTEGAPAAVPQAGWWTGTLCGYGHHAWSSFAVRANRTLTIEVTALDEKGLVRMTKAMPILGVWRSTDPTGTLPTVASAATAFNSTSLALTSLRVQSPVSTSFRIALADQRGAGRPDFGYQARVLYADAVAPASVGATGGTVTITGMGFRQGNSVFVNGIAASVTSWSATSIVATVPSLHELGLSRAAIVSITVQDVSTGGSSVMSGVLTYAAPVEALELISAPAGTLPAGTAASTTFSVKAIAPDGFTPIVGEAVSFAATGAGAAFSPCASHLCTVLTDAAGVASASVTPMTPGSVTLTATGRSGMAAASFTATSVADVLHVLSAPTGVATLGTLVSKPLRVQLLSADGVTPRAGSNVTITMANGAARVGACNNLPCTLVTDASGDVTTTVTPMSTGTISLQFASATAAVTASFSAAAETMQMKSAPGGTQTVGIASTTLFAVRVLAGDGITPMPGEAVVFTAAGAAVTFGACGGAVCTLTTDAQGDAQTSVSAAAPGAVTLSAVGNAGALTASFTAVALPDVLQVVSAPSGNIYVTNTTSPAFAVRITAADGFSPVAGKTVTFSAGAGAVIFGVCGAPVCVVLTDAAGLASTSVFSTSAGQVSFSALSEAGSATVAFTVAPPIRSVTAVRPVLYIAEGVAVAWQPQVTLVDNSSSTSNVFVSWSSTSGLAFSEGSSITSATGVALGSAIAGPLPAGTRAEGRACSWGTICAPLAAQGVSADEWRLILVDGAAQSVPTGSTMAPVTIRVVDAEGNPVAGVPVSIEQTVGEWEAACPGSGRCPVAATLSASQNSAVSNVDGLVTVTPSQISGVPTTTRIAAIAGSHGFATLALETHP